MQNLHAICEFLYVSETVFKRVLGTFVCENLPTQPMGFLLPTNSSMLRTFSVFSCNWLLLKSRINYDNRHLYGKNSNCLSHYNISNNKFDCTILKRVQSEGFMHI